jgi:hypothetical protein
MDADLGAFSKLFLNSSSNDPQLIIYPVKAHRARGNDEGWHFIDPVPVEVGAATHAFAAFDPNIKGKIASALQYNSILILHSKQWCLSHGSKGL